MTCVCQSTASCGQNPCVTVRRRDPVFDMKLVLREESRIHTIYFPGRDGTSRNRHERRARQAKWRKGKL